MGQLAAEAGVGPKGAAQTVKWSLEFITKGHCTASEAAEEHRVGCRE